MSYFMTVSGRTPENRPGVEFLPVGQTQAYIRELSAALAAHDGAPVFLAHDGESSTSSDFICASEDHCRLKGTLEGSTLHQLLVDCARTAAAFRIWWAADQPDDFLRVPLCGSLEEALNTVTEQVKAGQDIAVRWKRTGSPDPDAVSPANHG